MKISTLKLVAVVALIGHSEALFCLIRPLFRPIPLWTIGGGSSGGGGGGGGGGGTGPQQSCPQPSCPQPSCAQQSCPPPDCIPLPDPAAQMAHVENCQNSGFSDGVFNDNGSPNRCI